MADPIPAPARCTLCHRQADWHIIALGNDVSAHACGRCINLFLALRQKGAHFSMHRLTEQPKIDLNALFPAGRD